MAARNEAVAYETRNMEGGMDMFEKQFDGVVKVMEVKEIEMIEMRILDMFKKQFNGIVNVRLMGSVVIYMGMIYMKMVEMSKKTVLWYGRDEAKSWQLMLLKSYYRKSMILYLGRCQYL